MKRQYPKEITKEQREQIAKAAKFGLTDDQICDLSGVTTGNLRRHCAVELAQGRAEALLFVGEKLFEQIRGYEDSFGEYHPSHFPAIMFYLKTRGGWHELQGSAVPTNEEDRIPASVIVIERLGKLKSKRKAQNKRKAKK